MKIRKRMVVMGLMVMALMLLSMSLSMARSFPINPLFLAPGVREQGAYTMSIPGTYGHLVPLPRVPWNELLIPTATGKEEDMEAHHGTPMAVHPGNTGTSVAPPVSGGKITGSQSDGGAIAEGSGIPLDNMLSGAIAVSHVDYLENDLRDAIRKLNAK